MYFVLSTRLGRKDELLPTDHDSPAKDTSMRGTTSPQAFKFLLAIICYLHCDLKKCYGLILILERLLRYILRTRKTCLERIWRPRQAPRRSLPALSSPSCAKDNIYFVLFAIFFSFGINTPWRLSRFSLACFDGCGAPLCPIIKRVSLSCG